MFRPSLTTLLSVDYKLNPDRLYATYFGGDAAQGLEVDVEGDDDRYTVRYLLSCDGDCYNWYENDGGHDDNGHGHDDNGHGHGDNGHDHGDNGHGHDDNGHGHDDNSHGHGDSDSVKKDTDCNNRYPP